VGPRAVVGIDFGEFHLCLPKQGCANWARQEAVVADLCKHPHITEIVDCFQTGAGEQKLVHLVYRFAGLDMGSLLKEKCPPRSGLVRDAVHHTLLGVRHIHSLGLLHADIKPANLLVQVGDSGSWFVRVGDLGNVLEARGQTSMGIPIGE
jgi:serine/threonine protein kinase